jgi:hypothetical protein
MSRYLNWSILNCINICGYANDREISVNHLGSRQINGITWQLYKVLGIIWKVRCENNNFNNICEIY